MKSDSVLDVAMNYSLLKHIADHKDETLYISDLRRVVSSYAALNELLDLMQSHQMIRIDEQTTPRRMRIISITPKGENIIKQLQKIDDAISQPR